MDHPTKESFLKDVENHELTILKDDGLYRHLRFRNPKTSNMYFEIITYPGGLLYRGDMGSYVFERIEDMLMFFRDDKKELRINSGYWSEKVQAESIFGEGIKKFDPKKVRENVHGHYKEYFEDDPDSPEAKEVLEAIEDQIFCSEDSSWSWVSNVNNFSIYGIDTKFNLGGFWESSTDSYTYYFIWCCYAIAWAVIQYDENKLKLR